MKTARRSAPQRPQSSPIRRYLLGRAPSQHLTADIRELIAVAEALDRLLVDRGWQFEHEMAGLGALSWYWPPSGSPTDALYASDDPDAHELEPTTVIALHLDNLTDPHIVRVGDCTHSPDTQIPLLELPAALDELEAHRHTPRQHHVC